MSGDDQKGDIAIDDITLVQSACTVYPVSAEPGKRSTTYAARKRKESHRSIIIRSLDTDECLAQPCHVNATCTNTIGSHKCKCNKGYTGNGTVCTGWCNNG